MTTLEERVKNHPAPTQAAVNPFEPQYTWTFDERSLLIRLYLWVYQPSDPKNTTFCRLFWSVVCMPVTLPLRLALIVFAAVWRVLRIAVRGVVWPFRQIPIDEIREAIQRRRARVYEERIKAARARALEVAELAKAEAHRRRVEMLERFDQEDLGWWIWSHVYNAERPPKKEFQPAVKELTAIAAAVDKPKEPKGPSVQERLVVRVVERADHIAAFFQAHPEYGEKFNAITTKAGRLIVRFVFYPLMILVPLAVVSFAGYELYEHRKGLGGGTESVAVPTGHAVAYGAGASWEALVAIFLGFAVFVTIFLGLGWLILKLDKYAESPPRVNSEDAPKKEVVLHHQSAIGAQVDKITAVAWTGLKGTGRGTAIVAEFFGRFMMELFGRTGGPLGKVGGVIGRGCYGAAVAIVVVAKAIWWVARVGFKGVALVCKAIAAALLSAAALIVAVARSIGAASTTTGKFFIMGHHTLKSRTCPKIVITAGEEE